MTTFMSTHQRVELELAATSTPPRSCERCGCTDNDCTGCVERTGHPCHWITDGLCSACTPAGTAVRVPPSIAAVREIVRDLRQRVAVTGCSRLTAAVISQEFVAEWIADLVLSGYDPVPADLVDLYAATKAVLRSETHRAVRRNRGRHAHLVADIARAKATTAGVALVLGADGAAALLGFDDPQTMRDLSKVLADVADVIDPPKQAKR